jgi:hypothetical protein
MRFLLILEELQKSKSEIDADTHGELEVVLVGDRAVER